MGSLKRLNPNYITGLIDGEGYFSVHIRMRHRNGRVIPEVDTRFGVELREDEYKILERIKDYFECGHMYFKRDNRENFCNLWMYIVEDRKYLVSKIIPFFERYGLQLSQKNKDFQLFKHIVLMASAKKHWTSEGMTRIRWLSEQMHQRPRRDHTLPPDMIRDEDMVHAVPKR